MRRALRIEPPDLRSWLPPGDGAPTPHKLSDAEVVEIRELCRDTTFPYGEIGRRFGVRGTTIARLARGKLRRGAGGPIEGRDYPRAPSRRSPFPAPG